MFQNYLSNIFAKAKTGEAGERTYYSTLEEFLEKFHEGSQTIVEPRNSAVGIPDFKVQTGKGLLVGYVEAKDLGRDLDRLSKGEHEQIDKYKKEYPKLIVTNFIEFRLYENGEQVDSVVVTQPITIKIGTPVLDNEGRARGLFERFYSTTIQQVHTAKRLSELLAHKTRVLRGLIREEIDLTNDEETETEKLLETFKKTLKPDMTPAIFSDMYAQTIAFGLFVARINSDHQEFTRHSAHSLIPHSIPLFKKVFWILSGQEVPQHIKWQVDEIAEILANTKIEKITEEFFSHGKGRDPIIHFYETFLSEYDAKQREQLGVYYTPQPVVSYITRSINKILKKNFGKKEGFADTSVITLDPAAGTLTFQADAITIAKHEFETSHGTGGWEALVKSHILKNFYAFEILMAPYAVGHLKISLLLKENGYQMQENDRFPLYLTNTLDMSKFQPQQALLAEEISKESEVAYEIKKNTPVLVVMGNPPYSLISSNIIQEGTGLYEVYESYKETVRNEERNIQPLSDDYIKFLAFAHWKINQIGQGVVGMITNNSYLDGLIHRDIRRRLMDDFDEIYILNLHGSSKRKEKTPEGNEDENVFNIQQGVGIVLLVKSGNSNKIVNYSDVWGVREKKNNYLSEHDVYTTTWQELDIVRIEKEFKKTRWAKKYKNGFYFFSKQVSENIGVYGNFIGIEEILKNGNVGIATGEDKTLVDWSKKELIDKFGLHNKDAFSVLMQHNGISMATVNKWWEIIQELTQPLEEQARSYNYRPFDIRFVIYNRGILQRSRSKIMDHMLQDNLALCVTNSSSQEKYNEIFVTDGLTDKHMTGHQTYVFPLYIYNNESQQDLFHGDNHKSHNINWDALPEWVAGIQPFTSSATNNFIQVPEAIFYYIYAVLYSNIYREKYQEFLKSDFPRIPFTLDNQTFQNLVVLGEQLVELHLLKSKMLETPFSRYEGQGDNLIEKPDYHENIGRLYINRFQYFAKVAPEVWRYYIGGYQVLDKWLKVRKGRVLSLEDQLHFRKIITSLTQTIDIQKRIDKFYPEVEKSLTESSSKS